MPNTFSMQIDPNCLDFLKASYYQKFSTEKKKSFYNNIDNLYESLLELRKQPQFQFSSAHQKEISRGTFYAFTSSLKKYYLEKLEINLATLQETLKEEFGIQDKDAVDFIIMCLVDPVHLPFILSNLVNILLLTEYYSTNDSTAGNFKNILQAESGPKSGEISFKLSLPVKTINDISPIGTAYISFIFTKEKKIKLEPIRVTFNFTHPQEASQFKDNLSNELKGWVLSQAEFDKIQRKNQTRWPMLDFCIIPILIGVLFSLVAMVGMLALSFTPFSPLLIPPVYLGLSLILTSIASSYAYLDRKKDKEKLQRPIYLFHKKPSAHSQTQAIPSPSFFIPKSNQPLVENNMKYHP
ncbi:MAG: hypothetical protein WAL30_05635 [Candidatus Aquirickettsiella sp.]